MEWGWHVWLRCGQQRHWLLTHAEATPTAGVRSTQGWPRLWRWLARVEWTLLVGGQELLMLLLHRLTKDTPLLIHY